MELKEFISQTLTQIVEGVLDAQENTAESGARINPSIHPIQASKEYEGKTLGTIGSDHKPVFPVEFDVVISATDNSGAKGGAGIFVGSLGIGAQADSSTSNAQQNRIKFFIPIALPIGWEKKKSNPETTLGKT